MNFFDSLIKQTLSCFSGLPNRVYECDESKAWEDIGYSEVILQRDTAFELSGTGFNLVTTDDIGDSIVVVGEELCEIKENRSFARITLISINEVDDEQKAYNLIKKLEYVKYHCFPKGFMMRSASSSDKEAVRVQKSAIKNGIDFNSVGNLLIKKYKENPNVKGVKIIFVTASQADYSLLRKIAQRSAAVAKTLDHVMKSVNFDCDSCNLKPVCDEVEGMRELHFKSANQAMGGMQ